MLISVSLFRFIVRVSACACVGVFATAADVHVDRKLKCKQLVITPPPPSPAFGREVAQENRQTRTERTVSVCSTSKAKSWTVFCHYNNNLPKSVSHITLNPAHHPADTHAHTHKYSHTKFSYAGRLTIFSTGL